jgi:hypothetical protein
VPEKKTCFVICPIGDDNSEIRTHSDRLLEHIIKPVTEPNYIVSRADHISDAGRITAQIMRSLGEADLVVADITGLNANVMYELGIRQALNRPVIHMAATGTKLPFDVGDIRTIFYGFDIEQVKAAIKQLRGQVESYETGSAIPWNPASLAGPIAVQGDKPIQEAITELRMVVADLNGGLSILNDRIEGLEKSFKDGKRYEAAGALGAALMPLAIQSPQQFEQFMAILNNLPVPGSPGQSASGQERSAPAGNVQSKKDKSSQRRKPRA